MLPGMPFFDQTCYPYINGYPDNYKNLSDAMNKVHWSALAHSPWDNAAKPDFWKLLRSNAKELKSRTDKALMIVCGCNLFEWGTFLRRMDNFLMDLVTDQKEVERLLDALLEKHLTTLEKVCNSVGDIADIIRFGDDLGMDSGPFMAPEIYKKIFKPRHKILCDYVKKNSGMHTFLHSCGSIYLLIPHLIEAGIEIINPVQTSCYQMEPERLKREFGRDITFWGGGCETRSTLNKAKPDQIKNHVKKRLEIFSKDGGFVFNTVHNILPDVPPENIVAMFEAIEEFYR
jgi:uroporphyrinogen decarboxylase